jgi:hypothetical protein
MKEEALCRSLRRTRLGRGYGPIVTENAELMDEIQVKTFFLVRCDAVLFLVLSHKTATFIAIFVWVSKLTCIKLVVLKCISWILLTHQ